jgi:dienelactone hydrolase
MDAEQAAHGLAARNTLQLDLLEHREIGDAEAGLAFLRALPGIDARDVALVGQSFGGSLTMLMAERDPTLRAAVVFSAAGYSWDRSPELRQRLLTAAGRLKMPAFFIHAEVDYSLGPGRSLDAELARLGKPHRLAIYPAAGETPEQGHDFLYRHVPVWEADVFAFLAQCMRK